MLGSSQLPPVVLGSSHPRSIHILCIGSPQPVLIFNVAVQSTMVVLTSFIEDIGMLLHDVHKIAIKVAYIIAYI